MVSKVSQWMMMMNEILLYHCNSKIRLCFHQGPYIYCGIFFFSPFFLWNYWCQCRYLCFQFKLLFVRDLYVFFFLFSNKWFHPSNNNFILYSSFNNINYHKYMLFNCRNPIPLPLCLLICFALKWRRELLP